MQRSSQQIFNLPISNGSSKDYLSLIYRGVDGRKFLPLLWSNVGEKRTKTRSIRVHKLDFIASNVCFWVTWHILGEKIFKSITICENCLAPEILTPTELGVSWGSPTPLLIYVSCILMSDRANF